MDDATIRMLQLGQAGYYCSQIIILLGLEARGEENPALVRAMAGLAYGCGAGQGTCGALSGAACLLGLYAGKGEDGEHESESFMVMLQELSDWFNERVGTRYGGIACEQIVGEEGPAATRSRCGGLVAETYAKTMEILVSNGFDPSAA